MSRRSLLDALVVLWALAWLVAGIAVGREVRHLAEVTDSARDAGLATQRAGELVEGLSGLPIVGGQLREPAQTLREAGRATVEGADRGRRRTQRLGIVLGAAIALVPSLPLLLFYLPGRLAFERDRRAILGALADPAAEELLAARAIAHLPYRELRAITRDPVADLREGRHRRLAEAELARLGLNPPARGR